MKKFIFRTLLFFIPVFIYIVIVFAIDPYNYFTNKGIVADDVKKEVSFKLNYSLFKLLAFEKNPTANIILGDSRSNNLDIDFINNNNCSNKRFTNLAYGGGTLNEIITTFWEVSKITQLKTVVIGLNFNLYNKANAMNRVSEAVMLKKNFISHAISKYAFKATIGILENVIFDKKETIGIPDMTKDEFWEYQLNSAANNTYRIYEYPENYHKQLKKITEYCKQNSIELIFFIPPTHVTLQNKIEEFKLKEQEEIFKKDIRKMAMVYDFDFSNEITRNKEKFKDPYHCEKAVSEIVSKVVFCNKLTPDVSKYYKQSKKEN